MEQSVEHSIEHKAYHDIEHELWSLEFGAYNGIERAIA